jgi:hypothetical protein
MDVNMKQKRVTKSNADDGDGVRYAQEGDPVTETKAEESMQRNNEIAAMPTANTQREDKQHALNRTQFAPAGGELNSHPQRQHCANRVTDQL